jgi:hypothetical protein
MDSQKNEHYGVNVKKVVQNFKVGQSEHLLMNVDQ